MICTDVTESGIWLGATDFYKHIFCVLLLLLLLCAENDIYLALLYQIGHTLIIASPLAISTRRKRTHRAGRTCRAMVLKCSCIRSMTCFLLRASQGLAISEYKKQQTSTATNMLDGVFELSPSSVSKTELVSEIRMNRHTDSQRENIMCGGV